VPPQQDSHFSEQDVLIAMGRILDGQIIGERSRLRKLLRFLVVETLEGRHEQLKAYTIATSVLGRGDDFDPATDSIVRVEVNRLRQALDHYYMGPGRDDALIITIPKGQYVPVFEPGRTAAVPLPEPADETRTAPERTRTPTRTLRRTPSRTLLPAVAGIGLTVFVLCVVLLFVGPFAGSEPQRDPQTRVVRPTTLRLALVQASDDPQVRAARQAIEEIGARFRVVALLPQGEEGIETEPWPEDYVAVIEASGGAEDREVQIRITHGQSGEIVTTLRAQAPLEELRAAVDGAIPTFLRDVAILFQRSGTLFSDYRRRGDANTSLHCQILSEQYFENQTDERHELARTCAEDGIAMGLQDPDLYIVLAFMNREEFTDQRNLRSGQPALERAIMAARQAALIDPDNAEAHYAQMTVFTLLGSDEEMRRAGETAVALNPFDASILGGFASRLNALGDHERALELLRRAEILKPIDANWRHYAFFLASFALGDSDVAIARSRALAGSQNPLYLAARAIGAQLAGENNLARDMLSQLREAEPTFIDSPREMYVRRRYNSRLIDQLVDALASIEGM